MDIDEIRELVRLMVENDLAELDITDGENKIKLRRGPDTQQVAALPAAPAPAATGQAPAGAPAEPEPAEEEFVEVRSPMVGTLYAAADPESEPYVTIGSKVGEDTLVCIIEAMKVMNEIKAEHAGEVVEVCVKNGQPVEYGQVLFRLKPA